MSTKRHPPRDPRARVLTCRRAGLVLLLLLGAALGALPPSRTAHLSFTDRDGLPQRYVQALAMDTQGRLWAGTLAGVAIYEGQRWRTLDPPPSSFGTFVNTNAITAMSDGSTWIGTRHQGVLEYRDSGWRVHGPEGGCPSPNVNAVLESAEQDGAGRPVVWVATYGRGLGRWADGRWTRVAVGEDRLFCLQERTGGGGGRELWVGSTKGVWILEKGSARPFEGNASLPSLKVRCLAETRDGDGGTSLWLGLEDAGVCRWKDGRLERIALKGMGGSDLVRALLREPLPGGDALWVATAGGGVARFREGTWTWLRGLPCQFSRSLVVTPGGRHGSIVWIGTEGQGIIRHPGSTWNLVDLPWSGADHRVQCFWETPDPAGGPDPVLWAGGATQGILTFRKGRWTPFPPGGDRLENVRQIYSFPGSTEVWLASSRGLSRFAGGRLKTFGASDGMPEGQVRALAGMGPAGQQDLWMATSRGLVRWREGTFTAWPNPPQEPQGALRCLAVDGARLWVGTERGLACLEGEAWLRLPLLERLQGVSISSILPVTAKDRDPELWIGTFGSGAFRVRNPGGRADIQQLTTNTHPGLPNNLVKNLEVDHLGRVYIATSGGLSRYGPGLERDDFSLEEGLPSLECAVGGVWKDHGGRIWVGSQDGIAYLDPAAQPESVPAGRLALLSARAKGAPLPAGGEVGHGDLGLRFDYNLWTYYREADSRFRTQLVGLQSAPGEWRPERSAEFWTLPAGSYTLLVWGRDWSGQVRGPLAFPFRVRPAPWATPWAVAGYALLGILAVLAVLRARTRMLAERNRQLEARILDATAEVRSQKQALESLTEELLDLNLQKNEFMGIVAHDLRNPLSSIVMSMDLLEDEEDPAEIRRTLNNVKKLSQTMGELIGRFLDINRIESGKVKAEVRPLEVTAYARAKLQEFSPKAEAKRITLVLDAGASPLGALADPGFLSEVLDNLLSNALKFSPTGREVHLRIEDRGDWVHLVVQDQGPGLTDEDRKKLFARFARLSAKPTGGEQSVGLGLSIARHMVEEMGGRILVDSVPGQGASFTVELARAPLDAPPTPDGSLD